MDKKHLWIIGAFIVGVMAAPAVRKLPLANKLPSFG